MPFLRVIRAMTSNVPVTFTLDVKFMSNSPIKVSVDAAIRRGLLYVNGPVVLLMFVPMLGALVAFGRLTRALGSERYAFVVFCLAFFAGFAAAWAWWSYAVARWRVWAYERVADIAGLKTRAVQVGLTWPDGHVFERTEFKPAALARRRKDLEKERGVDV